MPTALPARTVAPPARRLSWPDTVRFFYLLARSRWLLSRLNAAHERVARHGDDAALLRAARRWLACHEEIGRLLGLPLPLHVKQVRAALRIPCP